MEVSVQTMSGSESEKIEVSDQVFSRAFNEGLIHQAVVTYLAGARQGSKAQKSRAERRGGGQKPWRQKGTGRARAGTIRSPIWRKGGVTFAAKPRDYSKKINKKAYKAAMSSIVSELVRQGRLLIVSDISLEAPSTKQFLSVYPDAAKQRTLIITDVLQLNLYLSVRNIPNVSTLSVKDIDPATLVSCEKVIITTPALRMLEEYLK